MNRIGGKHEGWDCFIKPLRLIFSIVEESGAASVSLRAAKRAELAYNPAAVFR